MPELYHIPFVWAIIATMIVFLISDRFKPSLIFLAATALLWLGGVLDMAVWTEGLSNRSIITIFLLIIITAGLNQNFNLASLFARIFGGVHSAPGFILRMGGAVAGFSALMNNTPVVAVMMPHVYAWGKSRNISPSKLLMPLSFSAILGGMITLIGTSTNLVLNGLLEQNKLPLLGFSDFLWPGLLVTASGLLVMVIFAPRLLKERSDFLQEVRENPREYMVELRILPKAELAGKTVEHAGLRNLTGIFLSEIIRGQRLIAPVRPNQLLEENDILLFAGETSNVLELAKTYPGLELAKTNKFNLVKDTSVVEAIVSQNSSLDRHNAKDLGFRERFDAVIIGIHRRGEKLSGKIGSQALRTGDVLLMIAGKDFASRNAQREDMIVLNNLPEATVLSPSRRYFFLTGLILSLGLSVFGSFNLFESLVLILLLQMLLGMSNMELVKRSLSLDLLIVLVSALALGEALIHSGAAAALGNSLGQWVEHWSPLLTLSIIFMTTLLLTSFVTNVAAIAIIFPVVFSLALAQIVPAPALFLTAAFGASCSFLTPFAYQTNLMVMELGNYKFADFLKLGSLVSITYAVVFMSFIYFYYLI